MIANPTCDSCGKHMVWIGIGPGAEPECPSACVGGPPCPACGSVHTEPFVRTPRPTYFGSWYGIPADPEPEPENEHHCWKCGNVWEHKR